MATLTPVSLDNAGVVVTAAAASGGGDTVAVGTDVGKVSLRVINADASSKTVTLTAVTACDNGTLHDVAVVVSAGTEKEVLIPAKCVNASGNCAVTYSAVTSVTVKAIKRP